MQSSDAADALPSRFSFANERIVTEDYGDLPAEF